MRFEHRTSQKLLQKLARCIKCLKTTKTISQKNYKLRPYALTYLKLCAKKVRLDRLQRYKVRPFSGFQTLWILILLCMYFNLQLDYTRKNFFYCRKRHKKSRLYKSFLFGS